jgi:tetratricopeptide (TPR) repeat protein
MRKLFEKVRKDISRFIAQRDDLLMVASCSDSDAGIVLQTLRDIEQASATDIFLLFGDNFVQANPFVSLTVERLREQHRIACEGLAEKGHEPLPPLPSSLFDESQPPHRRLRQAICFARSLVPREGRHRLVWATFPQQISDRREYLRLVARFVPWEGIKPWMAGIRLLFRDETDTAQYAPGLPGAPRVRLMGVDLGPAAMEASIREDVEDEELPEEERMQALLSLAILDYARNRTNDAMAKYNHLLAYYQRTENQAMQAFVVNSFGDIFHRQGDLDKAQHWYECAVPPAAAAKDPLILATLTRNLGDVSYKLGQYANAEQYYDGVDKLSAVTLDPGSKIRALEWRGLSQERQGKQNEAIESWEDAALLSRKMQLPELLRENLEHLKRAYGRVGWSDKAASAEAELRSVEVREVQS